MSNLKDPKATLANAADEALDLIEQSGQLSMKLMKVYVELLPFFPEFRAAALLLSESSKAALKAIEVLEKESAAVRKELANVPPTSVPPPSSKPISKKDVN